MPLRPSPHFLARSEGSALIVTLLLVTILTGLVVDFVYEVYIDTSALSNWGNAQRASLIAKSGHVLSAEFIKEINTLDYTDKKEAEIPVLVNFGSDVSLKVFVQDENAKFNVNSIISPNGLTDEKALSSLKKLLEYLNINPSLALAIADWIDPDSEPRLYNSEDGAKNTFLWSVDEVQLIEGIDKDIFSKIKPYITVFGNSRININTADIPVLVSLDQEMTEDLARRIIDYRETAPFENISAIGNVTGFAAMSIKIQSKIAVKPSLFRVVSTATVKGVTRVVESVTETSGAVLFWREG